jgi:hypothetical protein
MLILANQPSTPLVIALQCDQAKITGTDSLDSSGLSQISASSIPGLAFPTSMQPFSITVSEIDRHHIKKDNKICQLETFSRCVPLYLDPWKMIFHLHFEAFFVVRHWLYMEELG